MSRLCIKATDGKYKKCDRRLKEHFITDPDDVNIIADIVKELVALKDTSEVSSKQVLILGPESRGTVGKEGGARQY